MPTRTIASLVVLIGLVAALPVHAQTDPADAAYGRQAVSDALTAALLDGRPSGMRPPSTALGTYRAFPNPWPAHDVLLAAPTFHASNGLQAPRRYPEALAAAAAPRFDLDAIVAQSVATVLEEANPMLQQRGRTRQRAAQGGGSPERKWLGVGMMVVGGLWALSRLECVAATGGSFCTPGLVIGSGLAGAGYYLFAANR